MKFTVHLMTPYCTWEDVEAIDEDEAIKKCGTPPEFDYCEPSSYLAIEQDDDDEE